MVGAELARPLLDSIAGPSLLGLRVGLIELQDQWHQGFRYETAAENAKVALLVGAGAERVGLLNGHALLAMLMAL